MKYIVQLVRKINNSIFLVKKLPINKTQTTVRYNKRTFTINLQKPSLISNKKTFYILDVDSIKQIDLNFEPNQTVTGTDLDIVVSRNIISNLSSNLKEGLLGFQLSSLLIGALLGFLAGSLLFICLTMAGVI